MRTFRRIPAQRPQGVQGRQERGCDPRFTLRGRGWDPRQKLATHPTEKRPKNLFVVMEVVMKNISWKTIPRPTDLSTSRGWGCRRAGLNLAQPRAESWGARRLIRAPKCVGKSRDMNMNQPSKETPGHPKALGGLLSPPEALRMLHTEALFSAHLSAEPGLASGKGVGAAMAPAPGRFGRGVLLPLGDQAPCVPHHHGPLEAGALGELNAGTEGELDLMRGGQGTEAAREQLPETRGEAPDAFSFSTEPRSCSWDAP